MISSNRIIEAICEVFEVPRNVLSAGTRQQEAAEARFVAWVLLSRELRMSTLRIGRLLNRDRSNYLYAARRYDELMKKSEAFKRKVDHVGALIGLELG